MSETPARPYIGGQAVIEGVMMRSPGSFAVVCRKRSGELVVREKPMAPTAGGLRSWPLVRGVATVVESLRLGSRALRWSADIYEQDLPDDDEPSKESVPKKEGVASTAKKISSALALSIAALATQDDRGNAPFPESENKKGSGLGSIIPIVFAIGLFVAAPQAAASGIKKIFHLGFDVQSPEFQAITGAAKLLIVVGYLFLIRQIADVRRVFQYHGAEHKTITTYESGEELLVDNARPKTTAHPRCGTTFLVMVALVSIIVFSGVGAFLPKLAGPEWLQGLTFFAIKLPFLPVVAAVTFEIQRVFARYCTTGPLRVLLWPGFLVQKITTAEPDDAQLEVALASLRATLWREHAAHSPVREDRVFESYPALVSDPGYT